MLFSLQTELGMCTQPEPRANLELAIAPGSGLSLLRERSERLGGSLEIARDEDIVVLRVKLPA